MDAEQRGVRSVTCRDRQLPCAGDGPAAFIQFAPEPMDVGEAQQRRGPAPQRSGLLVRRVGLLVVLGSQGQRFRVRRVRYGGALFRRSRRSQAPVAGEKRGEAGGRGARGVLPYVLQQGFGRVPVAGPDAEVRCEQQMTGCGIRVAGGGDLLVQAVEPLQRFPGVRREIPLRPVGAHSVLDRSRLGVGRPHGVSERHTGGEQDRSDASREVRTESQPRVGGRGHGGLDSLRRP